MAGIAKMTEVSRQVAGADEQGIHAFDGRDCFDFFEAALLSNCTTTQVSRCAFA
jgi:uncharacterized Ntn-hydrolase superfamily protein